jgi:hypothetical protein
MGERCVRGCDTLNSFPEKELALKEVPQRQHLSAGARLTQFAAHFS